jgi:hypothetical protein
VADPARIVASVLLIGLCATTLVPRVVRRVTT